MLGVWSLAGRRGEWSIDCSQAVSCTGPISRRVAGRVTAPTFLMTHADDGMVLLLVALLIFGFNIEHFQVIRRCLSVIRPTGICHSICFQNGVLSLLLDSASVLTQRENEFPMR